MIQTKTEYRYAPAALTEPTPKPAYTGSTWGDLADYAVLLDSLLGQCNGDKALIRQYESDQTKGR